MDIQAKDGSGSFKAYVAMPTQLPAPAIILIQEIFGINADMRAKCDEFAQKGYIAIAPDLFWRQEPGVDLTDKTKAEWDKAFALLNGFNVDKGVDDLDATLNAAKALKDCTGKIGCVGYCLGGKLAYLMAARTKIDASVGYYGIGLDQLLNEEIDSPLLLHIAELDKFSNAEVRDKVVTHFKDCDCVTTQVYPGVDHAFARKNGEHYDATAANLANTCTDAFFTQHLKG